MEPSPDVTSLYNRRAVHRWERTSVGDLLERITWSYRSWALSDSEHCPVGGPERSWVTWSGGMARLAVTVFRHGRGCRWARRDPPSLRTLRARGTPG